MNAPRICWPPARLRTAPPERRSVYSCCADLLPRPGAPGQSAGTRPGAPVGPHNTVNSRLPASLPSRLRTAEAPLSRLVPRGIGAGCIPPLRCDHAARARAPRRGRCGCPLGAVVVVGLRLCSRRCAHHGPPVRSSGRWHPLGTLALRPRVTLSRPRWGCHARPLHPSATTQRHTNRHGARRPPWRELVSNTFGGAELPTQRPSAALGRRAALACGGPPLEAVLPQASPPSYSLRVHPRPAGNPSGRSSSPGSVDGAADPRGGPARRPAVPLEAGLNFGGGLGSSRTAGRPDPPYTPTRSGLRAGDAAAGQAPRRPPRHRRPAELFAERSERPAVTFGAVADGLELSAERSERARATFRAVASAAPAGRGRCAATAP